MKTCMGFVVLLFFLPSSIGQGQEQKQAHDGFWWVGSPETYKIGFITGYATAMVHAEDLEGIRCLTENNGGTLPDKPTHKALEACDSSTNPKISPYDFDVLRISQFAEGVDEFYKDFRNKNIEIQWAMTYVRDELKGKPDKFLDEELKAIRNVTP